MALRRLVESLPVVLLAACALVACKDSSETKEEAGTKTAPQKAGALTVEQLSKRCEQLGKLCGDDKDKDNHREKLIEECKRAAKTNVENGCSAKAAAAYDCYEKEICAKSDRVWAMDDFRVLAERHNKCVAERNASEECFGAVK